MKNRLRQPGFTLVEILIVILIIAIMALMLMPALSRMRAKARAAQCVHNLRHLHLAYGNLTADHAYDAGEGLLRRVNMVGYPTRWLPYLAGKRSYLICPDDPAPTNGDAAVLFNVYQGNVAADKVTYYYTRAMREYNYPNPTIGRYSVLSNFAGVFSITLNDHGTNMDGTMSRAALIGYTELSNSFLLDGGKQPNAGVWRSWRHDLLDWQGNLIQKDFTRTMMTYEADAVKVSYGINPQSAVVERGKLSSQDQVGDWAYGSQDAILLMDYPQADARTNHVWTNPPFMVDGQHTFARHFGKTHVLFGNGRVESFRPIQIDPSVVESGRRVNITNLWNPRSRRNIGGNLAGAGL
jgi:prepilin-type N-terminal cleavage/methylation domain-containing protein